MPYELKWEDRGVYWKFQGVVTAQEIFQSNRDAYEDPRFENQMDYQIVDFMAAEKLLMSAGAVREISELDRKMSIRRPEVRVAIAATEAVVYGLSRMYEMYSSESTWQTRVFDSLEKAVEWARQTRPPSEGR